MGTRVSDAFDTSHLRPQRSACVISHVLTKLGLYAHRLPHDDKNRPRDPKRGDKSNFRSHQDPSSGHECHERRDEAYPKAPKDEAALRVHPVNCLVHRPIFAPQGFSRAPYRYKGRRGSAQQVGTDGDGHKEVKACLQAHRIPSAGLAQPGAKASTRSAAGAIPFESSKHCAEGRSPRS